MRRFKFLLHDLFFFEKSTVLFARLILFEKSTVLFARFILFLKKVPFFSLKLVYDGHDGLISAVLNGKEIKNKEREESEYAEKYRTDEIGK